MGRLEELHLKESQIWATMKSLYEEAATSNKRKIENLKKALDEVQNHSQAITDNVCILLQTNREKFTTQLRTTLDKGWTVRAAQAAESHTYRADMEKRRKEGGGFYKLNNESVADLRTELTRDYQALADQHFEELAQLLEEFGESQEEMFHRIMEAGSTRPSEEPIMVLDSDSAEQEEPPLNTPEITTTANNTEENKKPHKYAAYRDHTNRRVGYSRKR